VIEQTPVSVQIKVPRANVTEVCRRLLSACFHLRHQRAGICRSKDVIRQLFGERRAERDAAPEPQPA
jgi:hypothetical protein